MSKSRPRLPCPGRAAVSTTGSRARRAAVRLAVAVTVVTGTALSTALPSSAAPVPPPPTNALSTLVVDANQPYRSVTHVASAALYGLDTASVPADSPVEPRHPTTFL